jgi:demethylmenaquinone methyltransferase/2-methoxy-6-polyprenyl-1,4-benzoquinol methylase
MAPWYDLFMKVFRLYRTEEITALLKLTGQERVLDLGGGTGYLAGKLVPLAHEVHLLDLSPAMAARCRRSGVKVQVGDALDMPYEAASFDVVIFSDFLHHVKDRPRLMTETVRVLRRGGRLLVHDFHGGTRRGRFMERLENRFVGPVVYTTPEALTRELEFYGLEPLSGVVRGSAFISLFLRR